MKYDNAILQLALLNDAREAADKPDGSYHNSVELGVMGVKDAQANRLCLVDIEIKKITPNGGNLLVSGVNKSGKEISITLPMSSDFYILERRDFNKLVG